VVPVNTRFSESEVAYVISDSGAAFTFLPGAALPDGPPFVTDRWTPPDVAAIFYTSGATGFPKGAMTTQEGFLANTETCHRIMTLPTDGSVRNLVSVPLFHVTGCNSQLLPTLETGGTTVIMPAFDVQAFLAAIAAERINLLVSVPAIYWLAMNQPNFASVNTRAIKWLMYGGAPIAPALVGRIMEAFPEAKLGMDSASRKPLQCPHSYRTNTPACVPIRWDSPHPWWT
jgi:long-chain acyl-CoA synthetase